MMWSYRSMCALIVVALLTVCFAVVQVSADEAPYQLRGTLTGVDGLVLAIDTREGKSVGVTLEDKTPIFAVTPATIADIQPGQFVGITSIMASEKRIALEVHIFAESLRGVGEGHYPWDLVPEENMMTNAAVAQIEEIGSGRTLELTYTEGENKTAGKQTITVPPEAIIVHLNEGSRDLLMSGAHVVGVVKDAPYGVITPIAFVVGKDGFKPPM